jgi:hypothetical protein
MLRTKLTVDAHLGKQSRLNRSYELRCRRYLSPQWKEPLHGDPVQIRIGIRAAVRNHHRPAIGIARSSNVDSTTPLVAIANRTNVSISLSRRII